MWEGPITTLFSDLQNYAFLFGFIILLRSSSFLAALHLKPRLLSYPNLSRMQDKGNSSVNVLCKIFQVIRWLILSKAFTAISRIPLSQQTQDSLRCLEPERWGQQNSSDANIHSAPCNSSSGWLPKLAHLHPSLHISHPRKWIPYIRPPVSLRIKPTEDHGSKDANTCKFTQRVLSWDFTTFAENFNGFCDV